MNADQFLKSDKATNYQSGFTQEEWNIIKIWMEEYAIEKNLPELKGETVIKCKHEWIETHNGYCRDCIKCGRKE